MLLHDAVRHGQAQAGAVLILLGGEEGIENARQHVLRNAASGVLHAQGRFAGRAIELGDHLQAAARRHRLRRVHHQHQRHLLDLIGVAIHRRQAFGEPFHQLDVLHLQFVLHQQHGVVDDGVQVVGLALAGLLPREGQQVLHQLAAALAFALDGLQLLGHLVAVRHFALQHAALYQPRVGQDAEQRVVDLMRHGGGQLADGGHLFRAEQRAVDALQLGRLAPHLLLNLGLDPGHFRGHFVEAGGQVAQLVVGAHRQAVIQITFAHPVRAIDQLLHRPIDHPPNEGHRQAGAEHYPAQQKPAERGLIVRDLRVHRGERQLRVHHPQHPLAGIVHVASRARAFGRVGDGADYGDQVMALLVPKRTRAIRPIEFGEWLRLRVAAIAGLGRLIHRRVDFPRFGGEYDVPVPVEDADALNAGLAAHLLQHVVQRVAVMTHHVVAGAA